MSENREIPSGWEIVKADFIGDLLRGITYKKGDASNELKEGYLPILRANNINGELNFSDLIYVPKQYVEDEQIIKTGDIIFAMSSGSKHLVGKSAVAKHSFYGSYGAFCSLFRVIDKVNKKYIAYIFKGNSYRKLISQIAKGTNINNLKREHILDYEIPIPPLPEQHRIVTKIEELFSSLDKGIESLKTAQQQLKVYRQAVLKWAFEGKLTEEWRRRQGNLHTADDLLKIIQTEKEKEAKSCGKKLKPTNSLSNERIANLPQLPTSWKWVSLGEIISDLTDYHANGSYLKMKENVQLIDTTEYAIMIRATNFEKENFKTDLKYITEEAYNFLSRSKLFGGEILIGKIGNAGKVYFMPKLNKPASLAMNLFALRFNVNVNKYIYYHLLSLFSKQQISSYVKGVGNPTIDKNSVRSLSIALPSYEEQHTIVAEIESRLSVCDKIEESIEHSLKQAEALRQSILKKAFEGRLVPQDPNDEPASVLLDRIKAERERNRAEILQHRQPRKKKAHS